MKIDIEDIKALEPGKIYPVSVNLEDPDVWDYVECLMEAGRDCDIKFIFFAKGVAELISAPEGMVDNLKDGGCDGQDRSSGDPK